MDFNATLIGQTIAMIVFVWFCMRFIWPPLMAAIETRQKVIADGLAAAERGQSSLTDARHEAERIIAAAREQAKGIVDQANSRAGSIVEEGRSEGVVQRQRELAEGQTQLELERARLRDELRAQVATIAIAGAERILAREIDPAAHRDLLDQLAREL